MLNEGGVLLVLLFSKEEEQGHIILPCTQQ
jgi:hypothetical protein